MSVRVLQWATGNVGRNAVEGVLSHPDLELVGARVYSSEKVGRDVGEVLGLGPVGAPCVGSMDEVLVLAPDCVVYAPMLADPNEVQTLLRAGINVVTPLGWFHVGDTPAVAATQAAALEGGATLHGTGIHPGGVTEQLPLVMSGFCRDVRHVRAEEFSDLRTYATEFVVREVMMFGTTPEESSHSPMVALLGDGFGQSLRLVAQGLGWTLDAELQTTHETAVATAPIDTPVGVLDVGTVAAQRFSWTGTVDGVPRVTARVNWFMGQEHLDPAWTFGPEGERFEVGIDAEPPLEVTFHGFHPPSLDADLSRNEGIVATAMHCVNSVPYVVAADPGILTYLDLPLMPGRGVA
ncbi:MAG: dihydrodipicolinate reductase [Actinomycetes bacterium]